MFTYITAQNKIGKERSLLMEYSLLLTLKRKKKSEHGFLTFDLFLVLKLKIKNIAGYYFCPNTLPKDLHTLGRLKYSGSNAIFKLQGLYSQHLPCRLIKPIPVIQIWLLVS